MSYNDRNRPGFYHYLRKSRVKSLILVSPKTVEAWTNDRWKPLIQGDVSLLAVGRGFFVFRFSSKEDCDLVFRSGPYFMGSRGMFLAPWTLDFNPGAEITAAPIWVRLSHLPLHLWGIRSLEDIGNKLGRFLDKAEQKGISLPALVFVLRLTSRKDLRKPLSSP